MKNSLLLAALAISLSACVLDTSGTKEESDTNMDQVSNIMPPGNNDQNPSSGFIECSLYQNSSKTITLPDGTKVEIKIPVACNPYANMFFIPDDPDDEMLPDIENPEEVVAGEGREINQVSY